MPTYAFVCEKCGEGFEQWLSIHHEAADRPQTHQGCTGRLALAITRVATYGVGQHGEQTIQSDRRERQLDLDRPAYKRFRDAGHQPRHLHGSHELEAKATDDWFVRTGGLVSVPDDRKEEVNEMLAEGATTSWSPIEQVHEQRGI